MQPAFVDLRLAAGADAPTIARLIQVVWPEEAPAADRIARLLDIPGRATCLAVAGATVVGLTDGFATRSQAGVLRWEVDLLAVHPDYRGQGLGARLVALSTEAERARGVTLARGLVAIANQASQRTFDRCGYQVEPDPLHLLVAGPFQGVNSIPVVGAGSNPIIIAEPALTIPHEGSRLFSPSAHLIPVDTLTYRGGWLEGTVTAPALVAARAEAASRQWERVGTLVPAAEDALIDLARLAGYVAIDVYQWWVRDLPDPQGCGSR